MALDPSLANIIANTLKSHINDLSKSNKSFRQAASAHNDEFKNIVGQIHKAVDFNNKNFKRTSSSIDSSKETAKDATDNLRSMASLIRNSTLTINDLIKEVSSLSNYTSKNISQNANSFSKMDMSLKGFGKRTNTALEKIGGKATFGKMSGAGAAAVGGAIIAGGTVAAGIAAKKQMEAIDTAKESQAEAAQAPSPAGPTQRETETAQSDSDAKPATPPSRETPSAEPAPGSSPDAENQPGYLGRGSPASTAPDAKPATPAPGSSPQQSSSGDRIPNPEELPPGKGVTNAPFRRVIAHISGFPVGGRNVDTGQKIRSTTEELELMKKGRYAKPGVKTGYGYHTAIASSYINRNTGEKIDETEYNKLSPEKKQQFEEKAELHEIRPYSARPFQAGPLNMESYGFATVGKVTPAKIEAMKTHLAKLYAEGKITREALDKIFGHGELQKHGGRGHMEHGGEGAPMASALRRSIDDILKRAEQIKKEQQEKKPETQQTPAPAPTPAPQPPRAETDAVPVPSTQTVNTRLAEMIKNEAMQRDKMESTPQSTPTENKPSVAPQSQTASYDNSSRPSMVSATNNWAPNLRSAQSYITETPKQQSAQA